MRVLKYLFTTFTLFYVVALQAQLVSDRPGISESSFTLQKKQMQIQTGLFSIFGSSLTQNTFTNRLRYGIDANTDVLADVNYNFLNTDSTSKQTINPLLISLRRNLQKFKSNNFSAALQLTTSLPFSKSSNFFDSQNYTARFGAFFDHTFTRFNIGYNAGLAVNYSNSCSLSPFYTFNISCGKKWMPFAEVFGEFNTLETFLLHADAGVAYLVKDNLLLDVSAGVLEPYNVNRTVILDFGVTWRFIPINR